MRQNPHVRICGGPGSATTLVYPTEDRHGGSAAGCAVGVGGFRDPAHLVRRASHPHDSPRLGVLAPSLALPRPGRRPAPRARRPLALLLQCHPAAPGVAVRSRDPDASDARRLGERANELERHLHGAGRSLRIPCGGRTRSRCRPAAHTAHHSPVRPPGQLVRCNPRRQR